MTSSTRARAHRSSLRASDVARLGLTGLRSRPMRAVLSALGIAIGIAAMVGVVGVSASSQAQLQEQLRALGTNMLTARSGADLSGTGPDPARGLRGADPHDPGRHRRRPPRPTLIGRVRLPLAPVGPERDGRHHHDGRGHEPAGGRLRADEARRVAQRRDRPLPGRRAGLEGRAAARRRRAGHTGVAGRSLLHSLGRHGARAPGRGARQRGAHRHPRRRLPLRRG